MRLWTRTTKEIVHVFDQLFHVYDLYNDPYHVLMEQRDRGGKSYQTILLSIFFSAYRRRSVVVAVNTKRSLERMRALFVSYLRVVDPEIKVYKETTNTVYLHTPEDKVFVHFILGKDFNDDALSFISECDLLIVDNYSSIRKTCETKLEKFNLSQKLRVIMKHTDIDLIMFTSNDEKCGQCYKKCGCTYRMREIKSLDL